MWKVLFGLAVLIVIILFVSKYLFLLLAIGIIITVLVYFLRRGGPRIGSV